MKKKKVYIVGVPKDKKITDKVMCEDITEPFNQMLEIVPDIDTVAAVIGDHESYKDFRPCRIFVDYEQQEAVIEFVKLFGKKTNLSVVK